MSLDLKRRMTGIPLKQWIKIFILELFCVLFIIWSGYILVVIVMPLFFDSYITKFIPWTFWKKSKNKTFRKTMEWVDSISFALIAVYFINTFFFQNYQIPSSSLEKSLLVGDFLCVSKLSYGARSPMTLLSFPLVQHTLPIFGCNSYLEHPQIQYKRLTGFGHVKRGDIVVFNFPAGDTVSSKVSNPDYYELCKANGRAAVWADKERYGDILYRPVDRRENFVKRCVGLPGDMFEVKDNVIYANGVKFEDSENVQHNYFVQSNQMISDDLFNELGISPDDYKSSQQHLSESVNNATSDSLALAQVGVTRKHGADYVYYLPMTKAMVAALKAKPFVLDISIQKNEGDMLYPLDAKTNWTIENYGPIWIPKAGATIRFDKDVDLKVGLYSRCIRNYEGNTFAYNGGKVYINGKQADSYTFKYDYYWMMGDNRDLSADSRYWGFVPEDHIVGQPLFIWLSLDKDKGWFTGKIRWSRLFTSAKKN